MIFNFVFMVVVTTGVKAGCPFAMRYPTHSGECNNILNQFRGSKGSQYDKFGTIPRQKEFIDFGRPNTRVISNVIFQHPAGDITDTRGLTHFVMQWGQFMDHDITLTPAPATERQDITIPVHDSEFRFKNDAVAGRKIAFTRSQGFTTNELTNDITAWIDGSTVYGSTEDVLTLLLEEGTARVKLDKFGNIPKNPLTGEPLAGDSRADVQPGLSSVHTLFTREHNRLVDMIQKSGLTTDVEQQFMLARLIVTSTIQAITYNQWLPAILGGRIQETPYDPKSIPEVNRAFAGATYRAGHSMIMEHFDLYDDTKYNSANKSYTPIYPGFHLMHSFGNDELRLARLGGKIEPVLIGLFTQPADKMDNFVCDSMRNNLFVKQFHFGDNFTEALDVVAINIQRGRDLALNDFRTFKAQIEGKIINKWSDLTKNVDLRRRLRALYKDRLDNIDLFVGALVEDHEKGVPGSSLPPTLKAAWINQWGMLQRSDRLFFRTHLPSIMPNLCKNPKAKGVCDIFNGLLKGTWGLDDVIRVNTKIPYVPDNPFVRPGFEKYHTNLPTLPRVDQKVNIGIPTYNPAKDIEEAIISIASTGVIESDEVEGVIPKGDTCGATTCNYFSYCTSPKKTCKCFDGYEGDGIKCDKCQSLIINGNFEVPRLQGRKWAMVGPAFVPAWQTTDAAFEIWTNSSSPGIGVFGGNQMIEISALRLRASVYQVVDTNPGDKLILRFSHRGREGEDVLRLHAGGVKTLKVLNQFQTNTAWRRYAVKYTVPEGQFSTRFIFQAIKSTTSSCDGATRCTVPQGNFIDSVTLLPESC